ncbi:TerB family tellurite resistance protein [Nordella sp. HKS 07]|uniref:tellurite resistance TerB family protein n=1 Tax=Nordella sp. HKS 07 TaxID=2712222 RepID=UPI0013E15716|nr:TerB family tellurite resistance protein [Nordella sp. HKS 07]QIG48075.1 TerB family tellurite resistance protein [Nordella sp. HKS 07]
MRTHPCVVVGLALDAARSVREGDRLTLARRPQDEDIVACIHDGQRIGHIPPGRIWVARLLTEGAHHEVTVTGFDTDPAGALAHIEIAISIIGDGPERSVIRSVISEIGDELRILAMIGATDGRLEPAERGVMEQFASVRAAELGLETDPGEVAHAVRWARRHVPNVLDVAGIVKRLTKERPQALPLIWEACMLVAEIDGRIAPEERQSMTTLHALLEQGMSDAKRNTAGG